MKLKKIEIKNQSYSKPKNIERYEMQYTTNNGETWYTSLRGKSVEELISRFEENEKRVDDMAWLIGNPDTTGVHYRVVHQLIHQIAESFDSKTMKLGAAQDPLTKMHDSIDRFETAFEKLIESVK